MRVVETYEPRKHLRDIEGYEVDSQMLLTKRSTHHRLVAQQVGAVADHLMSVRIQQLSLYRSVCALMRFDLADCLQHLL